MRIDLHTHSTFSDGTDTPAELMRNARRAGLDVVGLMDHDTAAGWDEAAQTVNETGVALVRGAELTSSWNDLSIHMLCYLPDPTNPALIELMELGRTARPRRARAMVDAISRDYPITWEDVLACAGDPDIIGRPHIADALVNAGTFPTRDRVFDKVLAHDGPYYVPFRSPSPAEVTRIIGAAGGVSVIAHPLMDARGHIDEDIFEELAAAGLAGIEADHRDHTPEQAARARRIAADLGLFVTGSSDYHGTGKQNRLGDGLTDPAVVKTIEERGFLPILWPES